MLNLREDFSPICIGKYIYVFGGHVQGRGASEICER